MLRNGFLMPVEGTAVIVPVKPETDHVVDGHVGQPLAVVVDFRF